MPLQSIPAGLLACPQGTDLADNSLGGVECTAQHPGSGGVADIVCHNAIAEYKGLCSCYFPPEWDLLRRPITINTRVETGPHCLQGDKRTYAGKGEEK